jgi:hypothetical protein
MPPDPACLPILNLNGDRDHARPFLVSVLDWALDWRAWLVKLV